MFIPLGIKSDYSLLKSLIKIPDLIKYLNKHNITTCGLLDENLFGSICFYNECINNNIKPIIGLSIKIGNNTLYLYAKNYLGYQSLLKINTIIQERDINYVDLKSYVKDIICVIPYKSIEIYDEVKKIYNELYIGYSNDYEKSNALILSEKILYVNEICAFSSQDIKYLGIIREIDTGEKEDITKYDEAYLDKEVNDEDAKFNNKRFLCLSLFFM